MDVARGITPERAANHKEFAARRFSHGTSLPRDFQGLIESRLPRFPRLYDKWRAKNLR